MIPTIFVRMSPPIRLPKVTYKNLPSYALSIYVYLQNSISGLVSILVDFPQMGISFLEGILSMRSRIYLCPFNYGFGRTSAGQTVIQIGYKVKNKCDEHKAVNAEICRQIFQKRSGN